MLDALRHVADGRSGPRLGSLGRRRWSRFLQWHMGTRCALLRKDLVVRVQRAPYEGAQPLNELDVTPYGYGVLAGAKIFDRTRRRAAA